MSIAPLRNSAPSIVISGIGMVGPLGVGTAQTWERLSAGDTGIRPDPHWTEGPLRLTGRVPDSFDARQFVKPRKSLKVMCREIQLGVSAAKLAAEDARIEESSLDPFRVGVVLGTDIMHCQPEELVDTYRGCTVDGAFDFSRWAEQTQKNLNPLWMLKYLPNMAASHVAIAADAQGPSNTIVLGEVSSMLAVMEAADIIASGRADMMYAGGTACGLNLTTLLYRGIARLSSLTGAPISTPRPFDRHRDGTVAAEGAGVVILETAESARRRGVRPYATVLGHGRAMTHRPAKDDPRSLQEAIRRAVAQSGLSPEDLDHVNASGKASVDDDLREALAIRNTLGNLPTTAPSSYMGSAGASEGILELLAGLIACRRGIRLATRNTSNPDEACGLSIVQEHTELQQSAWIKLTSTWTGQAGAMIVDTRAD